MLLFIFSLLIGFSLFLKIFALKGALVFILIEVMMWLVFLLAWSQKTREDRLYRFAGFCFVVVGIFWIIDNFIIQNIFIQNFLASMPAPFLIMGVTLFLSKKTKKTARRTNV